MSTPTTTGSSRPTLARRGAMILVGAAFLTLACAPAAMAVDTSPEPIPGSEGLLRVLRWIVWGAGLALLAYFVFGLVQAGRAKNNHGSDRVEAPLWPAIAGALVTGAGALWSILTGI